MENELFLMNELIGKIESVLVDTYGLDLSASANNHLISEEECLILGYPQSSRGAVIFHELSPEKPQDIFIGVYFSQKILELLQAESPLIQINNRNLDALCILIEEISHFHLILQRGQSGLHTTLTELELQAELDKVMVTSSLLFEQVQDPHLLKLVQLMFGEDVTFNEDALCYRFANSLANRFWYQVTGKLREYQPKETLRLMKELVRDFYWRSFSDKYSYLHSTDFLRKVS